MNTTCFDAGDMADNAAKAFREALQTHAEEAAKLLEQRDELLTWLNWAIKRVDEGVKESWQFERAQKAITNATQSTTTE